APAEDAGRARAPPRPVLVARPTTSRTISRRERPMTPDTIRPDEQHVDVCVVTWNTAELTATALRTLMDSDQGCTLRLLVRDNASTDGTPEVLKERVPEAEIDAGTENMG